MQLFGQITVSPGALRPPPFTPASNRTPTRPEGFPTLSRIPLGLLSMRGLPTLPSPSQGASPPISSHLPAPSPERAPLDRGLRFRKCASEVSGKRPRSKVGPKTGDYGSELGVARPSLWRIAHNNWRPPDIGFSPKSRDYDYTTPLFAFSEQICGAVRDAHHAWVAITSPTHERLSPPRLDVSHASQSEEKHVQPKLSRQSVVPHHTTSPPNDDEHVSATMLSHTLVAQPADFNPTPCLPCLRATFAASVEGT